MQIGVDSFGAVISDPSTGLSISRTHDPYLVLQLVSIERRPRERSTRAKKKIDPLNRKQYGAVSAMLTVSNIPVAVGFTKKLWPSLSVAS